MFLIEAKDGYQLNSNLEGQFEPFIKDGGKLPSFSISVSKLNADTVKDLIPEKVLGDYTFFKETENGFWISFCGSYMRIGKDFASADVYMSDKVKTDGSYEASYLLMQGYMYRLVLSGDFMIHSAAAVYQNNGILFCGLSGAGKSTQANLWKHYLQCDIINYDKPCVIFEEGQVFVHGSPWSGKEKLLLNEYAPLKAIIYVNQAKENRVNKLSPAKAFSNIYLHNYVYPLTKEIETAYINAINNVLKSIAVYELYCDMSEDAVRVLYNEIFNDDYDNRNKECLMKYKIKDCFEMKQIADEFIVIPRGTTAVDFNATVVFNESGAFLWNEMTDFVDEQALATALINKYSIDENLAKNDVKAFLEKMDANGLVDKVQ